jgi:hypothetical protein
VAKQTGSEWIDASENKDKTKQQATTNKEAASTQQCGAFLFNSSYRWLRLVRNS